MSSLSETKALASGKNCSGSDRRRRLPRRWKASSKTDREESGASDQGSRDAVLQGRIFIRASRLAICLLGLGMIASAEPAGSGAAARGKEIYTNGVDVAGAQIKCVTGEKARKCPPRS